MKRLLVLRSAAADTVVRSGAQVLVQPLADIPLSLPAWLVRKYLTCYPVGSKENLIPFDKTQVVLG